MPHALAPAGWACSSLTGLSLCSGTFGSTSAFELGACVRLRAFACVWVLNLPREMNAHALLQLYLAQRGGGGQVAEEAHVVPGLQRSVGVMLGEFCRLWQASICVRAASAGRRSLVCSKLVRDSSGGGRVGKGLKCANMQCAERGQGACAGMHNSTPLTQHTRHTMQLQLPQLQRW